MAGVCVQEDEASPRVRGSDTGEGFLSRQFALFLLFITGCGDVYTVVPYADLPDALVPARGRRLVLVSTPLPAYRCCAVVPVSDVQSSLSLCV